MQRALLLQGQLSCSRNITVRVAALSLLALSSPAFSWTSSYLAFTATTATLSSTSRLFSASAASPMTSQCAASGTFTVVQIPCLSDNYGYLIHEETTGQTAAIDTPDAKPYEEELKKRGWKLTHIFNTHHHWDHTGGNMELKKNHHGLIIVGPVNDQAKIPGIDEAVGGGGSFEFGNTKVSIIDVPGHTLGHIAFHFPSEAKVFVGDALFALGCGKMFEGTAHQFWNGLKRLRELPDDTMVYCAHEYTASNAKFAASVEPGNEELQSRIASITAARARGEPTVPSQLGLEKKTNPFLRCDISEQIRSNVGVLPGDSDEVAFGKVRSAKDKFRG